MKKHLGIKWWGWLIIASTFLVITHILFKIPAPFDWMIPVWNAGDLISFVGTITLGFVAIYQTKEANNMSKMLLEKELIESTPFIDIRPMLQNDKQIYKETKSVVCSVDNCFLRVENHFSNIKTDGEVLYFTIKNVRDHDILSIFAKEVEIGIMINGELTDKSMYSVRNSLLFDALGGGESTAFVIAIPQDSFKKIAELSFKKDEEIMRSLFLSVLFELTNNDGNVYSERIDLEIVNAIIQGFCSHTIVNKTLHKAEKTDKSASSF